MNINDPKPQVFNFPFQSKRPGSSAGLRLPFAKRIPTNTRNHIVAFLGEFVGTSSFLFFALAGTQVANNVPSTQVSGGDTISPIVAGSNPSQLLYISLCFGFSLAVNAWVFFRISGGLFNPAVTLGMCLVGALPIFRAILLTIAQILGGIVAAGIVSALFPGDLNVRTTLNVGTSKTQGLFIEMFLTFQLVFTIFMLAAEKHRGTFIAPIGIGLSLFIAELTGVYYTGGSVNPARSFGPCVILKSFYGYHWIYWVGPLLGTLLAVFFYKLMKILEYETANPDQDADIVSTRHALQAAQQDLEMGYDDETKMRKVASGDTYNTVPGTAGTSATYGPAPGLRDSVAQSSPAVASEARAWDGLVPGVMGEPPSTTEPIVPPTGLRR